MGDNFNENLKEARLKSGISQKDLAESIGVAKSTYSLYESGKREPNVDTIKKIASSLNVSADTLLGIDNEPITLAAHFEGDEYTESEVEEIKNFAAFVKNRRK
jgi:transcriptional regulator with XRE-family HTH domain|nr:MAG TPA: repressor protein [Caudoviricetes sp.]